MENKIKCSCRGNDACSECGNNKKIVIGKRYNIYAIVQKKDDYEYKKGEIVDISLNKKHLKMNYNSKFQKVMIIIKNFYF